MRPQFLERMSQRLRQLTPRLHDPACPDPSGLLRDARILYHDIAGTAPVLGFATMGETARKAEQLIDALLAEDGPVPAASPAALIAAHDHLIDQVTAAAA